jgi:hypothetical protein
MAKTKEQHEKDIVEVIKEKKICRISHIFGFYTDIKSSQFYNLKLEKSDNIKEAIHQNRAKGTGYLLNKWISSDNATLQIAAYRLICTPEERQMLNQQYIEMKQIQDKDMTPEETRDFVISTLKELKKRDE